MANLVDLLEEALGHSVNILNTAPVGGGCIHDARRLTIDNDSFFLKQTPITQSPLLETEGLALKALAETKTVRVPSVIAEGAIEEHYVLILEWIDLEPLRTQSGEKLGEKLALLHQQKPTDQFGWEKDNFIGSTPQQNHRMESWPSFFRENRLQPQLQLARKNGYSLPSADSFLANIETFFPKDDLPHPSPLHGDLWGGNAAQDAQGDPVLFDPAFYYGDAETDIAFSRFFGGFPESFYRLYGEINPPRPGWKIRQILYNLYHVLNHLNLFGSGYRSGATRMIKDLNSAAEQGNLLS